MPQALIVPPPPHPTTSPVPVPRRSGRSRLRVAGAALAALVVVGGAAFLIPQLVADGDDGKDQPAQAHKGDAVSRYARPLGDILVAGKPVTGSQRLPSGKYHYRRTYTDGPEYAAVTGYNSMAFGAAGLEGVYRDVLDGTDDRLSAPGDVVTTIDPKVQDAAYQALGGVTGAAVVIDPASGAILGLASTPSYDPGSFSGRTGSDQTAWKKATGDKAKPMLDRALLQTYPPGAAFELVVTAAALDKGLYTSLDEPTESPSPYVLPGSTTTVQNGTDAPCGNVSLRTALRESCNNVFAKAAADLGADKVRGMAEKFGFNTELRVPVHANQSEFPKDINPAETALSGLGQFSVTATPLQMAMVSAALENDGSLLAPRLVARVTDGTGKTIEEDERRSLARPVSARTAEALRGAMTDVVEHGAGAPARIDGAEVGGVPGGVVDNGHPASCFTSYARSSDGAGQVVVAVVVEGDTAHGDRAPASIARQIMKAALG